MNNDSIELCLSTKEEEFLINEMGKISFEKLEHPVRIFDKLELNKNTISYRHKFDKFLILLKEFYGFEPNCNLNNPVKRIDD